MSIGLESVLVGIRYELGAEVMMRVQEGVEAGGDVRRSEEGEAGGSEDS